MRRLCATTLVAALVTLAGCSVDEPTATTEPSASASPMVSDPTESNATVEAIPTAWRASDVRVRPGSDSPWAWEYSDDVVVIGPRGLVALDRETGSEVWRLPLGAAVCGATRAPSKVGLVGVVVGRCDATATAGRTTVKVIDLESASVVWQRPFVGVPTLDVGGEVLLTVAGCRARRWDLSTGDSLGALAPGCVDHVLAGSGVGVITSASAPRSWRVVDVESGSTLVDTTGPRSLSAPVRIVATDPLTVIAPAGPRGRPALVRVDSEGARVLDAISSADGFAATSGDSLVLAGADWPSATEFDLEDGSITTELPATGAEQWIPVTRLGDELLGVTGEPDAIRAGHGLLTLTSLTDDTVTTLGELAATPVKSDPSRAMLIDDVLLVPGRGNAQVVAYRLTLPG